MTAIERVAAALEAMPGALGGTLTKKQKTALAAQRIGRIT